MKLTVEIDDVEKKALEMEMVSIQEWLDNAIHSRAAHAIHAVAAAELARLRADPAVTVVPSSERVLAMQAVVESAAQREERGRLERLEKG